MNTNQSLDNKQQNIVAISAFTAKGDAVQLQQALNDGLDVSKTSYVPTLVSVCTTGLQRSNLLVSYLLFSLIYAQRKVTLQARYCKHC